MGYGINKYVVNSIYFYPKQVGFLRKTWTLARGWGGGGGLRGEGDLQHIILLIQLNIKRRLTQVHYVEGKFV